MTYLRRDIQMPFLDMAQKILILLLNSLTVRIFFWNYSFLSFLIHVLDDVWTFKALYINLECIVYILHTKVICFWCCFLLILLLDYGVDKYDIGAGFGHFGIAVEDVSLGKIMSFQRHSRGCLCWRSLLIIVLCYLFWNQF